MAGIIIDGRALAQTIRQQVATEIAALKSHFTPGLAVIQVGDNPASNTYVANKQQACDQVGIRFWTHHFPSSTDPEIVATCIKNLNNTPHIHGILVQLPLPPPYRAQQMIDCIDPAKDIDGLTTENVGRLMNNQPGFIPCTPLGCIDLLKTQFPSLKGKIATVLGRSAIVGRPLSYLLSAEHATVIMVHSHTSHPEILCQQSDIIIAAVGKPRFVQGSWVKAGAVVIDVGINRTEENSSKRIYGDVDFEAVLNHCKAITPVPGGVGPMTIAHLLKNVLKAAKQHYNILL